MSEDDDKKGNLKETIDKILKETNKRLSKKYCEQAGVAYTSYKKMKLYAMAIGHNPKNAAALNGIGNVYGKKENYSQAAKYHKRAIEADPTFAPAHANLGADCIFTGRYHEGIEHCKRAIELDSTLAYAYFLLSKAYKKIGKKALAREWEKKGNKQRVELSWSVNS